MLLKLNRCFFGCRVNIAYVELRKRCQRIGGIWGFLQTFKLLRMSNQPFNFFIRACIFEFLQFLFFSSIRICYCNELNFGIMRTFAYNAFQQFFKVAVFKPCFHLVNTMLIAQIIKRCRVVIKPAVKSLN